MVKFLLPKQSVNSSEQVFVHQHNYRRHTVCPVVCVEESMDKEKEKSQIIVRFGNLQSPNLLTSLEYCADRTDRKRDEVIVPVRYTTSVSTAIQISPTEYILGLQIQFFWIITFPLAGHMGESTKLKDTIFINLQSYEVIKCSLLLNDSFFLELFILNLLVKMIYNSGTLSTIFQ